MITLVPETRTLNETLNTCSTLYGSPVCLCKSEFVYLSVLPGGDEADFQLNLGLMLLIDLKHETERHTRENVTHKNMLACPYGLLTSKTYR